MENPRGFDAAHALGVERRATTEFREGQIRKALDTYEGAGKIVRSKTLEESCDAMVRDWYVEWAAGERSPMIADLNTMRTALNGRARRMLDATGRLGQQRMVIDGKEFRTGDRIVARRNKRLLQGSTRTFVKNGSTGTIVSIDADNNTVTVQFDREGVVRLPDWYIEGDNIDHAYARTRARRTGSRARHLNTAHFNPRTCPRSKRAMLPSGVRGPGPGSTSWTVTSAATRSVRGRH